MDTPKRSNCLWKSINIDDQKFSICVEEKDDQWTIFLTNLQEIWFENLDLEKILDKCQKLNPSLSIEDVDVVDFVKELLNNIETKAAKKSVNCIEFHENLEGGIFKYSIDLKKGTREQLWEKVTSRLCLFAGELQRRQKILLDLLEKKDEEITEYRLNGAELTRKHIQTKPFSKDLFKQRVQKFDSSNVLDAFKSVMNSQDELEPSIEIATPATRTAKPSTPVEEPIKSENKIKKETDSPVENGLTENNLVQIRDESSTTSVPKVEKSNSLLQKTIKNSESETGSIRRKARSAPSLLTKRSKKSIHDFIS